MRNLFLSLLLLGGVLTVSAQTSSIEVSYKAKSPSLKYGKEGVVIENQYNLLASPNMSKFYSPKTETLDSLESSPEGKKMLNQMALAAYSTGKTASMPMRDGTIYVTKDFDKNELSHYDLVATERYSYNEPIEQISWEVTDSVKSILGYECVKAVGDYHGRRWVVWFAPEIPLQNGPWKLQGLPGLILNATTADGLYSFEATGIEQRAKEMNKIYYSDKYEKMDRKNYLKKKRGFTDNPISVATAQLAARGIKIGMENVPVSEMKSNGIDFYETDYR